MLPIQRVPRGLLEILGTYGPDNPRNLEDAIRGTVALEQFYARSQPQMSFASGAIAEGGQTAFTAPSWGFLIGASMMIVSTATMTAYAGSLQFTPTPAGSPRMSIAHGNWNAGGLGAGRVFTVCEYVPGPSPLLMAPGNVIIARLDALGVDPTADVQLVTYFGALG